jgi:hypothetical protein
VVASTPDFTDPNVPEILPHFKGMSRNPQEIVLKHFGIEISRIRQKQIPE